MANKYNFTDETIEVDGKTLHRIIALKDFGDVRAGDLGGYIRFMNNLSQEGTCWVYDNAKVYGTSWVIGDAKVYDNAKVYGDAEMYDSAMVYGDSEVYGSAQLSGDALVYGSSLVYGDAVLSGDARVVDEIIRGSAFSEPTEPRKTICMTSLWEGLANG